jgi:hypothetical protein
MPRDLTNAELADRIEALHEDVLEVKALQKETNGRVRKIEVWQEGINMLVKVRDATDGARRAVIVGLGSAGAGAFLTYLAALIVHH